MISSAQRTQSLPRGAVFPLSFFILCFLFLLPASSFAKNANALPISTKYYSLSLPSDWVVLRGPEKTRDTITLQLADTKRTTVATLVVGTAMPNEAEKAVALYTKRLQVKPTFHAGQAEFYLTHGKEKGFFLLRESKHDHLLLLLTVSGDLEKAGFLFALRTPYSSLRPVKPVLP